MTHFPRARRVAFAIVDVVSRRWIDTLVSIEETSTQVRVIFDRALAAEGLAELITPATTPRNRHELAHFQANLRGFLRHRSGKRLFLGLVVAPRTGFEPVLPP